MQIRKIDVNARQDVQNFIRFPFRLYAGSPYWVPPLVSAMKLALRPDKHPFYRHSEAEFFVAEEGGQVLGRIAVLENRNCNRYRGTRTAFFGFFDVVEDGEIARALLNRACAWAESRRLDTVVGPRGLSGTDGGGVLVEGFDQRPTMGVPYNYPYYDAVIRAAGFEKETDYLSGYIEGEFQLPERVYRVASRAKERSGYWVKTFRSRREMRAWAPRVLAVHRAAFAGNHTYCPPTVEETAIIMDTLLQVVHPKLVRLVMHADEIVGFMLAYQDISPALQRTKGRLWPLGWLHVLVERKRARWANINGVGLLPAHQGLGAMALLYTELGEALRSFKFEHVELVQAEQGNVKSINEIESFGGKWYKTHRSYARTL